MSWIKKHLHLHFWIFNKKMATRFQIQVNIGVLELLKKLMWIFFFQVFSQCNTSSLKIKI